MNKTSSESLQQTVKTDPPSGIARRRILRAGLAAPVVLAVSGRSAMAGDCAKGLSPLAWNSLAPNGTNCYVNSHTVGLNTLGGSIVYWKNHINDSAYSAYKNTQFKNIFDGTNDNTIGIILGKDQTQLRNNYNSHFCAAYLNTEKCPGYAVSLSELQNMFTTQKLLPTDTTTTSAELIETFLKQTWEDNPTSIS